MVSSPIDERSGLGGEACGELLTLLVGSWRIERSRECGFSGGLRRILRWLISMRPIGCIDSGMPATSVPVDHGFNEGSEEGV